MNEKATMSLAEQRRLDMRRNPNVERPDETPEPAAADASNALRGFWKDSEDRACRDGVKMRSDARGLPHNYEPGPAYVRGGQS